MAATCPPSSLVLTFVRALVPQEFVPTSLHKRKHYLFQIEHLITLVFLIIKATYTHCGKLLNIFKT